MTTNYSSIKHHHIVINREVFNIMFESTRENLTKRLLTSIENSIWVEGQNIISPILVTMQIQLYK